MLNTYFLLACFSSSIGASRAAPDMVASSIVREWSQTPTFLERKTYWHLHFALSENIRGGLSWQAE